MSTGIAGAFGVMCLADFGADVVKVETPEGDPARAAPGFAVWNRNKRGVVVDAAVKRDRQWLRELLATADLCVVSDPESWLTYGLDPQAMSRTNPGLVVLEAPPYHGPASWYGGKESHGLLAAATGVSRRQSSFDGGPVEPVYPHLLYLQGIWAAACAMAALIERQSSGFGQTVTVSGVHAMMEACSGTLAVDPTYPDPITANGPGGPNPCYSRYRCSDGRWLFVAALTPKFQMPLLALLDLNRILNDERLAGCLDNIILPENRGWVRARIEQAFATRDRDTWLARLDEVGVPSGPLLERAEWLDHPQIEAIGMRATTDDPERGPVVTPGNPLTLTATPATVRRPAPRLGEHGGGIDLWPARAAPTGLPQRSSGTLTGYQILDLGAILAGPYAGHLLAELGAEVIKVEPPSGDAFRDRGFTYNRGMRGLALDLRDMPGREAFYQLVGRSDVMIDNYRPGVLPKLGIDYDILTRVNPQIITLSITGFGEGGPLSHLPGFDPVLQAMSGMMTAQGGDDQPVFYTIAINDVTAAALSVLGVCVALFHRGHSGRGQRMWTCLAGVSAFLQSGELVRYPGRAPAPVGGRDYTGDAPFDRFYQVTDGWIRIAADTVDTDALASAGLLDPAMTDTQAALSAALANLPRAESLRRLAAANIPAAPARHVSELLHDRQLAAHELFHTHRRSDSSVYCTAGRFAAFSRTQRHDVLEPPGLGQHTKEVLLNADLTRSQVDELLARGAAIQGHPMQPRITVNYR